MRDYAELILDLRRHHCDAKEDDTQEVCEECAYDVIVADKSKFNGITDVCTCGLMHRAADAIEELLAEPTTIRKQLPHWISVEERLPEENKNYLTYGVFLPLGVKAMDMNRFDGTKWLTSADVEITHWMPLPEPPKEVQDG